MVSPDEDERIDMQTAESAVPIDVGCTSETFHPAIMLLFMGFEALMRTALFVTKLWSSSETNIFTAGRAQESDWNSPFGSK